MGHTQSSRKRSIGFKACEQEDADLITWWEAMPKGARSNVLRTLIRAAMQIQAEAIRAQHQYLDQLSDDTAWLKQALNDLPGYLETVIGRVATTRIVAPETQVVTGGSASARAGRALWVLGCPRGSEPAKSLALRGAQGVGAAATRSPSVRCWRTLCTQECYASAPLFSKVLSYNVEKERKRDEHARIGLRDCAAAALFASHRCAGSDGRPH